MARQQYDDDPLEGLDPAPSAFVDGDGVGTTYTMILEGPLTQMQGRNFDTNELEFWPDNNPKMVVVARGFVKEYGGELRSFWAKKPSKMFAAFREAQQEAGERMAAGGTLLVRRTGQEPPPPGKRGKPTWLYRAKYIPPKPADPMDDEPPARPAQRSQQSRPQGRQQPADDDPWAGADRQRQRPAHPARDEPDDPWGEPAPRRQQRQYDDDPPF